MIHNDSSFGYGSNDPNTNGHDKAHAEEAVGLTVERYAEAKRLDLAFLKSINVKNATYDFTPAIRIVYPDELGKERYHRYRTSLYKEPRFKAPSRGSGAKPIPYGLQTLQLARQKGYCWIPEGESDTQLLWLLDHPSVGIPGVEAWTKFGPEWVRFLHGIPVLLVPVEHDTAGEKLWTLLSSSEEIRERLYRVDMTSPAFNDLGDLWVDAYDNDAVEDFRGALQAQIYLGTRAHQMGGLNQPNGKPPKRTPRVVSFTGRPAPKPREWIVRNAIPKGHATSWYGAGGVGKTFIALHFAMSVADPDTHQWVGMPVIGAPVIYGDFELDQSEHEKRAKELLETMGLDDVPSDFYYLNLTNLSPKEALAYAAAECKRVGAGLFILDSVGYAMAGDLSESRDVIRFFRQEIEAIKSVGTTPLLIDHQAKVVKGEKYGDKTEFGSVYKSNSVRASFQLRGAWEGNSVTVTFTHRKANMSRILEPFSLRLTFEGESVKVEKLDAALPDPDHKPTTKDKMVAAWLELGEATCSVVAEHADLKIKTVWNLVGELCETGWIHDTGNKDDTEPIYAFGPGEDPDNRDQGDEGQGPDDEPSEAGQEPDHHPGDEGQDPDPHQGDDGPGDGLIVDQAGVDRLTQEIRAAEGLIALDLETSALQVHKARIRLLTLKTEDGNPEIVDLRAGVDVSGLLEVLRSKHLLGHNLAYDLSVLAGRHAYVHEGGLTDTMLLFQVFYGGTNRKASLGDALSSVLDVKVSKAEQAADWMGYLTPEMLSYAAADVAHLHTLADALEEKIQDKAPSLRPVVDLEHRMVKVTAHMKAVGMGVDAEVWAQCVEESRVGAEQRLEELDAHVGEGELPEKFVESNTKNKNVSEERNSLVNWNSPAQTLWVFKDLLGVEEIDGKPLKSTGKEVLPKINHPAAAALLEYRRVLDIYKRFRATELVDGRVYGDWSQLKARTGRMACSQPPLQGIPDPLRRAFVAPPGYRLVVSDLSQIEVRVLAVICKDENLRADLNGDVDVHRRMAANVFGKPVSEVSDKERRMVKQLVFGSWYGMGLAGFTARVNAMTGRLYTHQEVQDKFRGPLFDPYPKVQAWMDQVGRDFKKNKHVSYTLLGRRRLQVPDVPAALNTPIQAGACDVMKAIATHAYSTRKSSWKIIGLVHDEILLEVPQEEAEEARAWIKETMVRVGSETLNHTVKEALRVPVDASSAVCETWADKE
jgi:DNA polymerase-1